MFGFINEKRKNLLREEILQDFKKLKIREVLDDSCGMKGSWDYDKTPNLNITKVDKIFGDNAENLNFKNKIFDCVVFAGVIQYLERPIKALQEVYRVLKPKGYLLISVPNANSIIKSLFLFKTENLAFTQKGLNAILKSEGFKVLKNKLIDFSFIPKKRKMIIYSLCKKT